jgi:hypothetical protein
VLVNPLLLQDSLVTSSRSTALREDSNPARNRVSDLAFEFGLSDRDIAEFLRHFNVPPGSAAGHLLAPDEFRDARESLLQERRFWGRRFSSRHPVVLDASNAAYFALKKGGKPSLENIVMVRKALERRLFVHRRDPSQRLPGARVWTVAEASLRREIDHPEAFLTLVRTGEIDEAPQGMKAARFFLPRAEECCACVASNAELVDYQQSYPRSVSRIIQFELEHGQAMLELP